MLNALLVDDEWNNLENLKFLLENDCDNIKVMHQATNGIEARTWLSNHTVDVVFLDVNMPKEDGFEMLQKITDRNFKVIFVTAYNEFALKAIKASAVDYLLKPVNIAELQNAVQKLTEQLKYEDARKNQKELLNHLLQNFSSENSPTKIAIPYVGGLLFTDVNEIVALEGDGNYSIIHKTDLQKIVVTKTLKDFEDLLDAEQFLRIHKGHIINLNYVKEYSQKDGGSVKMEDGSLWSISRRQLDLFLQKIKNHNVLFFQ
jgi:two-component system, LytTR family, response regulator